MKINKLLQVNEDWTITISNSKWESIILNNEEISSLHDGLDNLEDLILWGMALEWANSWLCSAEESEKIHRQMKKDI